MKKSKIIIIAVVIAVVAAAVLTVKIFVPSMNYNKAEALMTDGKYSEAISAFTELGEYKDCADKITECKYLAASDLMNKKNYEQAAKSFEEIKDYKDSSLKAKESNYLYAGELMLAADYEKALNLLVSLTDYEGSAEKSKECKYLWASAYESEKKYAEALNLYKDISDYKDAAVKTIAIEKNIINSSNVGDIVYYGALEHKVIEWKVLAKDGNKVLVISKDILDCQQYHWKNEMVTWEECSFRRWLNGTFDKNAFSAEEMKCISVSELENTDNPVYDADGGANTKDRIFILSYEEVNQYLPENKDRLATGAEETTWWIRTPSAANSAEAFKALYYGYSSYNYYPCYINTDGGIYAGGSGNAVIEYGGVRPAMWIEIA